MDAKQLRDYVVAPTLKAISLHSESAERLVMGTAAHESGGFRFIHQVGGGPALSLFQIEPATYTDLVVNTLPGLGKNLRAAILPFLPVPAPPAERLLTDLAFATVVCRLLYYRAPAAMPADPGDALALAQYWKQFYNTPQGAGQPGEWVLNFRKYCPWYQ